jgi:CxxC motif-containing protein (DUF1111 family)
LAVALVATVAVAASVLVRRNADGATAGDPRRGSVVFATSFTPAQGLGPLFNNTSCLGCHNTPAPGGGGPDGLATVLRVGQLTTAGFDPMLGRGGPLARAHSVSELGVSCALSAGVPSGANVTSVRNAPSLFGAGRLDAIPDAVILAGAVARRDGISGKPNLVDGRVSRFGWKADTLSLQQFVGEAFRNELGLTTPIAAQDFHAAGACGGVTGGPEVDSSIVADVVAYIASLPDPPPTRADAAMFNQLGCGECHVPSLGGVALYSDLLLHDMGRALDDGFTQATATGHDWRTSPLWGLSQRSRFLHDGRARSIEAAILAHGGEADAVAQRFRALPATDRGALLAFLSTL